MKQLVKDYLTRPQNEKLASLAPGDSAILEADGETFATYRSPDGELFAVTDHRGVEPRPRTVPVAHDA